MARELGFSEEAKPCDMKRENQRRETDRTSKQECGYAMLTPRTMMVISIKVLIQSIHAGLNNKTALSTLPPVLSLSLTSLYFSFNYIFCVFCIGTRRYFLCIAGGN